MPSVLLFIYFCFVLLKDVKKGIIQIVVILQIFIYLTLWNTSLRLIYPTSVVAICIFVYRKCRKRRLVIYRSKKGHYKIFCVNGNTGFRNESRIFYFIHLQNEEAYERKESSSA